MKNELLDERFIVTGEMAGKTDHDRCLFTWERLFIPYFLNDAIFEKAGFHLIGYPGEKDIKFGDDNLVYISGDTLFNFKDNLGTASHQKYEYYRSLITKDFSGEKQERYLAKLDECRRMHHSILNFGLMPQTGGMNNFKGSVFDSIGHSLDRLDVIVFYIFSFYEDKSRTELFSRAYYRSRELQTSRLKTFLNMFDTGDPLESTFNFCKVMFSVFDDKSGLCFVKRLIESGKKPITTGDDVVNYMGLAEEYWTMKYELITDNKG